MRFSNNFKFHVRNVNDMRQPLTKIFPTSWKKSPNEFQFLFNPQTESCLLLLCLTICALPRPKIFRQNSGVTEAEGHRIKPIRQLVSSSWVQKYRRPKLPKLDDKSCSVLHLHVRSFKTKKTSSGRLNIDVFLNSSNSSFASDAWIRFHANNERYHWPGTMLELER